MLRIVHLTSVHKENDNRIFYKECQTLQSVGYDISLICAGSESKIVKDIKIYGYPKKNKGRIYRIFKTSFIDMIKMCRKVEADIYHFHDPELIFVGLYLKIIGKKVIYDIHENNPASILSKSYIKYKFIKKILAYIFDKFEKFVSKFFDAIVTARPDITKRFNHKQIITLRNFPILPDFNKLKKINIKKYKPVVIFVGGMTKIRGIYELLEAFEELNEYELWLLGPIQEKELETKINNSSQNIKYFGIVEAYEVFSYIQKADIGIITFLEVPNHINTLATKPFEYMACGKPMIMSNFPYWKDTFKDGSLYVDPSNPKEIAQIIKQLLSNPNLIKKMGEYNKQMIIDEYNWEKESQKLIKLYNELNN